MIWYDIILYYIIWYDIIWYDIILYYMTWYDIIWYDMILYIIYIYMHISYIYIYYILSSNIDFKIYKFTMGLKFLKVYYDGHPR